MTRNYPTARKSQLLKEFDNAVAHVTQVFVAHYGEEQTHALVKEAHQEYEALIPGLPYIGGKQPFTQFIVSTAWFLAMYRVLQRHGRTVDEVGRLVYQVSQAFLMSVPGIARRLFGHMTFSPWYSKRLKKRAAESHTRRYPGDHVYSYVEGDGETFDYGVDYTECAACKYLSNHGALELAPYLCAVDKLYSEMMGWGLRRTMTLAEGYDKCDFRFKRGGTTMVAVPPALDRTGS